MSFLCLSILIVGCSGKADDAAVDDQESLEQRDPGGQRGDAAKANPAGVPADSAAAGAHLPPRFGAFQRPSSISLPSAYRIKAWRLVHSGSSPPVP